MIHLKFYQLQLQQFLNNHINLAFSASESFIIMYVLQFGFTPNSEWMVVPSIFNAATPPGAKSKNFFLSGVLEYKLKLFVK